MGNHPEVLHIAISEKGWGNGGVRGVTLELDEAGWPFSVGQPGCDPHRGPWGRTTLLLIAQKTVVAKGAAPEQDCSNGVRRAGDLTPL